MKKLSLLAGATLIPATSAFAGLVQPTELKNVFHQAAWQEYAEDISMDMGDPSLIHRIKDTEFKKNMYSAINSNRDSFNYTYSTYTIDNSECGNMQITYYKGDFDLKTAEHNVYAVSLQQIDANVETLRREGCAPAL